MPRGAAARRYAKALFQLAAEDDRVSDVRGELSALAELLERDSELRDVLLRPIHPVAQRRAVMAGVADKLGASQVLQSFYAFLIDQRRLVDFDAIRGEYERLADESRGITRAEVVTAGPLGDEQLERLRRALAARTGRDVVLTVDVDPTLLGGAIAKVGDLVFDGSLRTQLAQLRADLMKG